MSFSTRRRTVDLGSAAGDRSGQALVEFALVFPVLVLMLLGIFDFGRGVYAYNTIANAARVGARVAAVNQILTSPDCNENHPVENPSDPHWSIQTCAADAAVSLGVTPSDVTVAYSTPPNSTMTCTSTSLQVGCIVSVTVHYAYTPMTPVIGNLIGTLTMDSTSQVLVDRVFP